MSILARPYNVSIIPATAATYYHPKGTETATAVAVPAVINATDFTWTQSTLTLTKTAAFTNYTFVAGDTIAISAGTGATIGTYTIASRTSNDAIVLTTSIGAGADGQSDIAGNMSVATQVNNRGEMNLTNSPKGIIIYSITANSVAAANTDSIAIATQAGTTISGAIFLARSVTPYAPVADFKPQGMRVKSNSNICFTTTGTTGWTVQWEPFVA